MQHLISKQSAGKNRKGYSKISYEIFEILNATASKLNIDILKWCIRSKMLQLM